MGIVILVFFKHTDFYIDYLLFNGLKNTNN